VSAGGQLNRPQELGRYGPAPRTHNELPARVGAEAPHLEASLCVACVSVAGHVGPPQHGMVPEAKTTQIYEATNQIQRIVMARQLLRF